MELPDNKVLLGNGALTWLAAERRSDRYGTVWLANKNSEDEVITTNPATTLVTSVLSCIGKPGSLVCEILEARESTHSGDYHHRVYPKKPNVGDIIEIGRGIFFTGDEKDDDGLICLIGLRPTDNRSRLWLDINKLYNVHEQTVNLYFIPA